MYKKYRKGLENGRDVNREALSPNQLDGPTRQGASEDTHRMGQTPVVKTDLDQEKRAICGDIGMVCPSPFKIVRIFTSSTFTDTKNERNMLMKHAYPKVKDHCRKIGYEFQVVDMRWGVRNEATDDHMTTELCMKELKFCQEVSTGPNFVSLLSHKYGYTPLERVIEAIEFETIMAAIDEMETKQLFHRWYSRDDNAVPSAYVLSPISSRLPDFLSHDADEKNAAKYTWWAESERMQTALYVTAKRIFNKEMARKYIMSVTETEVQEGILRLQNPSKHCLWFKRNIDDIERQPSSKLLSRFIECTEEKWKKSRGMLRELKEERMSKALEADRIFSYRVKWNQAQGISPENEHHHKEYLDRLCGDFVKTMTDMIDASVQERELTEDSVIKECHHHIRFCQSKCQGFQGRKETLKLIKQYVQGQCPEPLVLHGSSGTGKTSIMAMAAKMVKQWTAKPPAVVIRFIGTSPQSSSLLSLLESTIHQINRIYEQPTQSIDSQKECLDYFDTALTKGQANRPLIVILDSLDQLDSAYDARKLSWLPTQFNANTKVIVSTLPETKYECFPILKKAITSGSNLIEVPLLSNTDVHSILDGWLSVRKRCLTDQQKQLVFKAFEKCPTPLFLKLSFDEAATWTSFSPLEQTVLQDTVRASIDFLFQKLEKTHGKMLVSRALGYLTIAKNGVTEAELEDILSCDDDVLNDVYMYWTPPIRRLPPLLLVRIRADLSQYLVERGADGVNVIYWYHRQFIEAASARYCSDPGTSRLMHERLADFFQGTWAGGRKKPYTSASGEFGEEDRNVSLQPLQFGTDVYNLRTLNNLPYHRVKAGQLDLLKDECLANPDFLIKKMYAWMLHSVLSDCMIAREAFPQDKMIREAHEALRLSHKGLAIDPRQLVPQLLQRLKQTTETAMLLQRCRGHPSVYLVPNKPVLDETGGQLVHTIPAHSEGVRMIDLTENGKITATVSQNVGEVSLWKVDEAKLLREVKGLIFPSQVYFCNHDKWLIIGTDEEILVQDVETGRNIRTWDKLGGGYIQHCLCVAGEGKIYVMETKEQSCRLVSLLALGQEGDMKVFSHPQNGCNNMAGSNNYVAMCDEHREHITVYNLNTNTFRPKFLGHLKSPYEDVPGDIIWEHHVGNLAILPDETGLAYTLYHRKHVDSVSEVVFADFDGNRLRNIPDKDNRSFESLRFTLDGAHMYLHHGTKLCIFNVASLEEVGKFNPKHCITDVKTIDMINVLTVGSDGNIRIWDLSRQEKSDDDLQRPHLMSLYYCKFVKPLSNPRYLLAAGQIERFGQTLRLEIYDVFKQEIIRSCDFPGLGQLQVWVCCTVDPKHVLLFMEAKSKTFIFRVDFESMTIVKKYVGFTWASAVAEDTKEVLCTTRGQMHVKVYDVQGDFASIIKAGQKDRILKVWVNSTGTLGCGETEGGLMLLYDIKNRKHLYTINTDPYIRKRDYNNVPVYINRVGSRLTFMSRGSSDATSNFDFYFLLLWDIQEQKEIGKLFDMTCPKSEREVTSVSELSDSTIITNQVDYIFRVWDLYTGKLLKTVKCEYYNRSREITISPNSPYIVSTEIKKCILLRNKDDLKSAASFSLDGGVIFKLHWSRDGQYLVTLDREYDPDITIWNIYQGKVAVNEITYEETFTEKKFETVTISKREQDLIEEEDPDTDSGPEGTVMMTSDDCEDV